MDKYLAIAAAAVAFGLAGCATDQKAASSDAGAGKEQETITGSRIPSKSTSGGVQSVSGEAWKRETTSTIGNAPRGN